MSMSSALGEIIALGLTPLMVPTPDYIALMNIVWFIPAALGFVLCIYKVWSIIVGLSDYGDDGDNLKMSMTQIYF